ncbi:MAG TPA: TIGR03118 family protein [Rhizomicrobium sp.]|nr:TIGR03118 family protein [Rhizomicrobium sp.]
MRSEIGIAFGLVLLASTAWAGNIPAAPVFKITKLVSDQAGKAKNADTNLVNAWGLSQAPGGPLWVSDNGTGLSTVYNQGTGVNTGLVVTIPSGVPTGTVYNISGFKISENGKSGAAQFIFDSEAGIISGWNFSVDSSNAIIAYDGSAQGSVYKGLAIDTSSELLFAADFHNNQVQIFDSNWNLVGAFTDKSLPKRYAPFDVAVINGSVYVTFAKQDSAKHDEIDGPGLGYVDVFDEKGNLVKQLTGQGPLNAPWGMAIAPSTFGSFAGDLLVGNFGDGWVNAFDPTTGTYAGPLSTSKGPIAIDGLWGLDAVPGGDITFSAGPRKENHGLVGLIKVAK